MKLVFATNNAHKLAEFRAIAGPELPVLSLAEIGCNADIPETGDTLQANALQKARWVAGRFGCACFADDTGLEVDALGGEPGVHSARYAPGTDHDSAANTRHLLSRLDGKADRHARFRTVIALVRPDGEYLFEGSVEGEILTSPAGDGGFGYDPVFRPDGWQHTFAQASAEEKNSISHRGRATRKLIEFLRSENTAI